MTFLGVGLSIFLSLSAGATEGFWTSLHDAPPAVRNAWPKTFSVYTKYWFSNDVGTASLVWVGQSDGKLDLYFLSANHVVNNKCRVDRICPNTSLVQNLRGKVEDNAFTPAPLEQLFFDSVEVLFRADNPDLILLHVTAPLSMKDSLEPLKLPTSCDIGDGEQLYAVGFPATADRTSPLSLSIPEKDLIQKRWSKGIFVRKGSEVVGHKTRLYYGTTIDALGGNSGGPILNSEGTLVGVLVDLSQEHKAKGFPYLGIEDPANRDWHSLSVRCEHLQSLRQTFEGK